MDDAAKHGRFMLRRILLARSPIRSFALAALIATSTIGAAHAGGLEANGYNWDLLFDPGTYVGKGTVTQVTSQPGALTQTALVQPFADFTGLGVVGVVVSK